MFFTNLSVYKLPSPWAFTPEQMEEALQAGVFVEPSSNELLRQGWASPRPNGGLVHTVNKQMLIRLVTEKKLLPASVINQVTKARAAEIEEQQGFSLGKRAMKELKERVADELLPRAFSIKGDILTWIDPVNGWLVVNTPSASKSDEVVKILLKAIDKFPLENLRVQRSPTAVMTEWLKADEAPAGFTVDMDCELRATGESKAAVRYVRHTLDPVEINRHIDSGKQCTRLAMTWDSKISFVLTESLTIKGVKPLDVISEKESTTKNEDERYDSDFMLMSGELAKMLNDIVESLGGYAKV